MTHLIHIAQLDEAIRQQAHCPAFVPLRRLPTAQRAEMRFIFSRDFALLGPFGLGTTVEHVVEPLLGKAPTDALDGGTAHFQRIAEALIRPSGTMLPLIRFQQHARMHQFARRCSPSIGKFL